MVAADPEQEAVFRQRLPGDLAGLTLPTLVVGVRLEGELFQMNVTLVTASAGWPALAAVVGEHLAHRIGQ